MAESRASRKALGVRRRAQRCFESGPSASPVLVPAQPRRKPQARSRCAPTALGLVKRRRLDSAGCRLARSNMQAIHSFRYLFLQLSAARPGRLHLHRNCVSAAFYLLCSCSLLRSGVLKGPTSCRAVLAVPGKAFGQPHVGMQGQEIRAMDKDPFCGWAVPFPLSFSAPMTGRVRLGGSSRPRQGLRNEGPETC